MKNKKELKEILKYELSNWDRVYKYYLDNCNLLYDGQVLGAGGLYRYNGCILEFYYTRDGVHGFVLQYINRDEMSREYIDTFDNDSINFNYAIWQIYQIIKNKGAKK